MPRRLRFLPSGDGRYAVEVMTRCFQGRFFLAKTSEPEIKRLFLGVWAHALLDFPEIELCNLKARSTTIHVELRISSDWYAWHELRQGA